MQRRRLVQLSCAAAAWLALAPIGSGQTARELLAGCKAADVEAVTQRLKSLGDEGAEACIALLVRGEIEATPAALDAARAALPAFRARLRADIAELIRADPDAARWQRALDALALVGEAADLPLALQLAAEFPRAPSEEGEPVLPLEAAAGLRSTAAAIFAREPRATASASHLLEASPPELDSALIGALGDCHAPEAFALLGEMLSRGHELAGDIAVAISNAARALPGPFDSRVRDAVRWTIERESESGFREAVICAGWLDDEDAVRTLIALLRHESSGVRADAKWSLERITGVRLGPDAARWSRWLADEEQWWQSRAAQLLSEVEGQDATSRVLALNELVRHRFPRHEMARELAGRLDRLAAEPFALACETLVQLGSPAAVPYLESLRSESLGQRRREALDSCLDRLAPASAARTP